MAGTTSQCGACRVTFTSLEAFDTHRVGSYERRSRRCISAVERRAKGMTQDEQGRWKLAERDAAGRRPQPVAPFP
jgi:hypothetical protein